mgnify:FL=1
MASGNRQDPENNNDLLNSLNLLEPQFPCEPQFPRSLRKASMGSCKRNSLLSNESDITEKALLVKQHRIVQFTGHSEVIFSLS